MAVEYTWKPVGTGFVPVLPVGFIAGLVDTGRWRERGVTHWHLTRSEAPIFLRGKLNEETRFNRALRERQVATTREIAWSPSEALTWLAEEIVKAFGDRARTPDPIEMAVRRGWRTEDDWLFTLECSWESLSNGWDHPVGGGVALRRNHSLDLFAYANRERCHAP